MFIHVESFWKLMVLALAMCALKTKRLINMNNKSFGKNHGISHFFDGFNVHKFKFAMPCKDLNSIIVTIFASTSTSIDVTCTCILLLIINIQPIPYLVHTSCKLQNHKQLRCLSLVQQNASLFTMQFHQILNESTYPH